MITQLLRARICSCKQCCCFLIRLQVPRDGHLSGGDCSPQLLSDSDESDNQDLLAFAAAACDALAESDDDLFSLEGPSSPGVTGDKALFSDRPVAQMNGFTNMRIQDGKADLLKNETRGTVCRRDFLFFLTVTKFSRTLTYNLMSFFTLSCSKETQEAIKATEMQETSPRYWASLGVWLLCVTWLHLSSRTAHHCLLGAVRRLWRVVSCAMHGADSQSS